MFRSFIKLTKHPFKMTVEMFSVHFYTNHLLIGIGEKE